MDQGDTLRNKIETRFNKLMANIDQSESEYSDINDNEVNSGFSLVRNKPMVQTDDDSYDESDSYETMSDGLAELLGKVLRTV